MDNVYEEFSYSQIESIIHSFDGSRSLCTSNSWEVYKGDYLGKCVTVKIWWHPEKDDVEHFKHEMNFLKSQADSGQDIVNILGHCSCSELVALVLDLAPLCVLDGILTDKGFKWISRLKVALGIAQTISFLHDQLPAFVLRNLEPSHIMIDVNHKPVLYDFGFGKSNVSIFNTNEFKKLHTGHSGTSLTAYDVFDYGSIVLALLAMKPVLDAEKGHVVDHINSLFMVKSNPVIWEPSFIQCDGFCFIDAKTILAVALKCVGRSAKRPSMKEIVSSLENLMEIKYRNWCDRGMRHACSADQEPLKSKTAADIQELTGGFNREKVLWDIGFIVSGCKLCLFRGEMKQDSDNCTKEVTVKCCNVPRIGAGYFRDEMMFLTHECMTSHPNLAKLIGYCEDATMFAVIYDVASLCALEDKLTDTTYGWCQRMRAAFGIASAVAHLHSQNPPYVLHNLNPANIVLDKALKPIIVDYALLTGGIFGNKKFFSEYYIGSQAYLDHSGKYYVVDGGYLMMSGFLVPYQGVRYHLKAFRDGGDPITKREMFNHAHSSLKNIIERCFGVLKACFPILKTMPSYPYPSQVQIVVACMAVHNFIRQRIAHDWLMDKYDKDDLILEDEESDDEIEEANDNVVDRTTGQRQMKALRTSIANAISYANGGIPD